MERVAVSAAKEGSRNGRAGTRVVPLEKGGENVTLQLVWGKHAKTLLREERGSTQPLGHRTEGDITELIGDYCKRLKRRKIPTGFIKTGRGEGERVRASYWE